MSQRSPSTRNLPRFLKLPNFSIKEKRTKALNKNLSGQTSTMYSFDEEKWLLRCIKNCDTFPYTSYFYRCLWTCWHSSYIITGSNEDTINHYLIRINFHFMLCHQWKEIIAAKSIHNFKPIFANDHKMMNTKSHLSFICPIIRKIYFKRVEFHSKI